MRVTFVIVVLGFILQLTDSYGDNPPAKDTGFSARMFPRFKETDYLGTAPANTRFVFIMARHGMVVPVDETYPKDRHFKTEWKKDRFTRHGRWLMTKLGRSLATRYKGFIEQIPQDKVYVSTIYTSYGTQNAEELLEGLYDGKTKPEIFGRVDCDKYQLLKSPDECKSYAKLKNEVDRIQTSEDTKYFEFLKQKTGEKKNQDSEWYTNSRDRVYRLWEILDFERKSKRWSPLWYGEEARKQLKEKVDLYFYDASCLDGRMTPYVIGPMFYEFINDYYKYELNLHIHVTNDFTYAVFRHILTGNKMSVPEFGETLLVEVDNDLGVKVHEYKPYRINVFKENIEFVDEKTTTSTITLPTIRDKLIKRGIIVRDHEWKQRCNGGSSPSHISPPPATTSGQGVTQLPAASLPPRSVFPTAEDIERAMPKGRETAVYLVDRKRADGSTETERTHWQPVTSAHDAYQFPRGREQFRQTIVRQTPGGPVLESTGVSVP